jgi:triose/dihydroxyacetone kinase / FAD-AMP lyase (cyclizing)
MQTCNQPASPSLQDWAAAARAAATVITKYGGAGPGSRTMLDALLPAVVALEGQQVSTASLVSGACGPLVSRQAADAAARAAMAASEGALQTAFMAATAGRASYVPLEVLRNNPDPGAVAVSVWMQGIADALLATATGRTP